MQLCLVVGTGTEVGKTWVTCGLARRLRDAGWEVAARKPAQSFDPREAADGVTDAHLLAAATGDGAEAVCPAHRCYSLAMAPPMAADAMGRPSFTVAELVREIEWPDDVGFGLVEAAGGLRSPLAHDGDGVALAVELSPDRVILVGDAGLGTINAVRLCADALSGAGPWPLMVILNRYDERVPLHRANRDWLADRDGLHVVTGVGELADALIGSPVSPRGGGPR
ncbi:MAG: ATP-dependent dethiobiotin synthetase BioD [Acidimicrobiales bacterium]